MNYWRCGMGWKYEALVVFCDSSQSLRAEWQEWNSTTPKHKTLTSHGVFSEVSTRSLIKTGKSSTYTVHLIPEMLNHRLSHPEYEPNPMFWAEQDTRADVFSWWMHTFTRICYSSLCLSFTSSPSHYVLDCFSIATTHFQFSESQRKAKNMTRPLRFSISSSVLWSLTVSISFFFSLCWTLCSKTAVKKCMSWKNRLWT